MWLAGCWLVTAVGSDQCHRPDGGDVGLYSEQMICAVWSQSIVLGGYIVDWLYQGEDYTVLVRHSLESVPGDCLLVNAERRDGFGWEVK